MLRPTLLLVTLIATPVAAQTASYTFFGSGCAQGQPWFTVQGVPRLGSSVVLTTSSSWFNVGGGASVTILTGVSNQSAGGVPLPFDLTVLNGAGVTFGGSLLQSSEFATPVPFLGGPTRLVTTTFSIPNNAALLGTTLYQQVWEALSDVFTMQTRHVLSRGGQLIVGV